MTGTTPRAVPPEDVLSAYLDDELDAVEREQVDDVLTRSPEWRALLDELAETRSLVRALPVRDAPASFWDAVLDQQVTPLPARRRASHQPRRGVAAALGVVAVATVAAVVALAPSPSRTTPPVATLVDAHASHSSVSEEPVSRLAPVAVPVSFERGR